MPKESLHRRAFPCPDVIMSRISWTARCCPNMNDIGKLIIETKWHSHESVNKAIFVVDALSLIWSRSIYPALHLWEQISVEFEKNYISGNSIWKCCLQNVGHFVSTKLCLVLELAHRNFWFTPQFSQNFWIMHATFKWTTTGVWYLGEADNSFNHIRI